jgi:hypothetical protein
MANSDTLEPAETTNAPAVIDPNVRWKVKLTDPENLGKVVFSSISENRARAYIERRYPRGSEAHLVSPAGVTESYEKERMGVHGTDVERWAAFDPSTWVRPVSVASSTTGMDEYSDQES